ncbi:MAG: DHH family phosphoesterase [Clostridiaceae bacterium]|nr:DHH family phosphoesterase [Clostridiaceae bacterium]
MDKKLAKLLEPGFKLIFAMLIIFVGVTFYYSIPVACIEGALAVLVFVFYRRKANRRSNGIKRYVETLAFQVDNASKNTIVNFPLPMVILRLDNSEIVWQNESFESIVNGNSRLYDAHITEIIPGFDTRWIMEGKTSCPFDVQVGSKKYNVYGNIVKNSGVEKGGLLATLFWVDITEYSDLRERFRKTRPVVAVVLIDSHEELYKNISESEKSMITAEIDSRLSAWFKNSGGVFRKLERGKYLTVFETSALLELTADKFSIIESMHEVKNSEGIPATLSIGIGKGEECSLAELYGYANLGIDMALSRGGDQVVTKSPGGFEFFGGQSKEIEKRTKVKSRVMANALRQLIKDSSQVFIMGHRVSDLDSIGSCAGVVAAVRKCGKPHYVVINRDMTLAKELIDRLLESPEYNDVFISEDEAMLRADAQSLLVVVDTSRPDIVEAPRLLESIQKVAVIDHHRRSANYIEKTAINMHEPYASSASELVTELLQYIITPQELLKYEAEALLAGIVLDTKSFTVKTGVRTFEAAAYLKQIGADTIDVRKMFSGNLESYIKRYQLISGAKHIFPGISLVVSSHPIDRAVASQAIDELVNISDVSAAFAVYPEASGGCAISGRSYGQINVQFVLEKIGGGGSMNMAGAQFSDKTTDEVVSMLHKAIEEYLKETKKEEKDK